MAWKGISRLSNRPIYDFIYNIVLSLFICIIKRNITYYIYIYIYIYIYTYTNVWCDFGASRHSQKSFALPPPQFPRPDLQNATDVHSPPTTLEGALGNPKIPGPEQLLTCAFSFAMFWNWKHVHPVELKLLGDFPKPKCPEYMLLVHPIELELFGDSPKPECPDYMVLTSYKLIWANAKLGLSNLSKFKQMPSMGFLVGAHLMKCQAWTFKSEQVWARLCFQIPKHLGRLMASLMTNLMVPPILLKAYVMRLLTSAFSFAIASRRHVWFTLPCESVTNY